MYRLISIVGLNEPKILAGMSAGVDYADEFTRAVQVKSLACSTCSFGRKLWQVRRTLTEIDIDGGE